MTPWLLLIILVLFFFMEYLMPSTRKAREQERCLEEAAIVLSSEISHWKLRNADIYPRVRLWQRIIDSLGINRRRLEKEILRHKNPFIATTLTPEYLKGKKQ